MPGAFISAFNPDQVHGKIAHKEAASEAIVLSNMLYACRTKVVPESLVLVNKCTLLVRLRDCMRKLVDRAPVEDLKS